MGDACRAPWLDESPTTVDEGRSDRLLAEYVLGSRRLVKQWLTEPAVRHEGRSRLDLIGASPGVEVVKDLLTRMEYRVYA